VQNPRGTVVFFASYQSTDSSYSSCSTVAQIRYKQLHSYSTALAHELVKKSGREKGGAFPSHCQSITKD
jgi:hypothetical protein